MDEYGAVQNQMSLYTDAVNRRAWEGFYDIFAPDGVWEVIGPMPIRLEGLVSIVKKLPPLVTAAATLVQLNSPAAIEIREGIASARSTVQEWAEFPDRNCGIEVLGLYDDELHWIDGRWLFVRRTCTIRRMSESALLAGQG